MKHIVKYTLALFICTLALLGLVACAPSELSYEEQKTAYDGIIEEYTALLTASLNGEELPVPDTKDMDEREAAIAETLYGVVAAGKGGEAAKNMGYGFQDMDGNGTPELILLSKYTAIRAIFTLSDGKPLLLEANYGAGGSWVFATDHRFFIMRSTETDGVEEGTVYVCRVDGDKMVYDTVYGQVYDRNKKETLSFYQMVDGRRTAIDRDTYEELDREFKQTLGVGYNDTSKLLAPYVHLPLEEKVSTENRPVADFSSYEAIRETYKAISTCLENFNSSKWFQGEYDNLFAFPDDDSYVYYNRLLYAAYHSAYGEGYDEIDLNGDGKDELVILNEDYTIKAIFTMKKGTPVMLDAFANEVCWLDEEGMIHVDRTDYYELEYSLYEFTKEGDYNLVYSILVAENGNRYLTKDGKTEIISFEDSLTLYYDEYRPFYTEPFGAEEYNRSVSGLTYTPLTPYTEDPMKTAVTKMWRKSATLDKTSGKEFGAWSNTCLTFDTVTDTQMNLHIRYEFSFHYPDPDRENNLLVDTTESQLDITATIQDGVLVFDGCGIKGHIEFGQKYLWLVIEEGNDERFPVGYHRLWEYKPEASGD